VRLYFDTAYIAKCYLNEPDGKKVRALARRASGLASSAWCLAELACVLHRHVREGAIRKEQAVEVRRLFLDHVHNQVWTLFPVSNGLLHAAESLVADLPPTAHLRAGDAVHLVTAQKTGFAEIWSSDRHLLAAARYFGLEGKSV